MNCLNFIYLIIMGDFDLEKVKELKSGSNNTAVGLLTASQTEAVLKKVMEKKKCSREEAMALAAGLCQRSGTNRTASSNVAYQINGNVLTATEFQKICAEEGKGTARQFARTMADTIVEFSRILGEEGDLARQMRFDDPTISSEEAVWCSNFQSGNPNCPETARTWLTQDLRRRFPR
jgi:hypothetical protein